MGLSSLVAVALLAAAIVGCQGLDDDRAFQPRHQGSYLIVQPTGADPRLDRDLGGAYTPDYGRATLGLDRVSAVDLEGTYLAALDSATRRIAARELTGSTTEAVTVPGAGPLLALAVGRSTLATAGADATLRLVNRAPFFVLTETWSLGFVPRVAIYSAGRYYLADSARVAVFDEQARTLRTTITLQQPLTRVSELQVDALGQIIVCGVRGMAYAEVTVDNLALTVRGTAEQPTLRRQLYTPFVRQQFGRERTANASLTLAGAAVPTSSELMPGVVTDLAYDFRGDVGYYVLGGTTLAADGPATGDARTLLTVPGGLTLRRAVHAWQLP